MLPVPRAQRVGELVVRDPEEPGAERRALVAVAVDGRQRGDERPLGGVLGVVVVAQEVEAVAVDAVQVPAIERAERGAVALRGADVRQVGVRRRPARARRRGSTRHAGTAGRTPSDLAAGDDVATALAVLDHQRPGRRRDRPRARARRPAAVSTLTAEPSVEQSAR